MPRAALATLLAVSVLGFTPSASASPPQITLLGPANGATLAYPAYGDGTTKFSWHVNWDAPEQTTVMFELGTDPNFAPGSYTQENFACAPHDRICVTCFSLPRASYPTD